MKDDALRYHLYQRDRFLLLLMDALEAYLGDQDTDGDGNLPADVRELGEAYNDLAQCMSAVEVWSIIRRDAR